MRALHSPWGYCLSQSVPGETGVMVPVDWGERDVIPLSPPGRAVILPGLIYSLASLLALFLPPFSPTLLCCKLPATSLPWALEMRAIEKCFGARCWCWFSCSIGSCTMVLMVNALVLCWEPCGKIIVRTREKLDKKEGSTHLWFRIMYFPIKKCLYRTCTY